MSDDLWYVVGGVPGRPIDLQYRDKDEAIARARAEFEANPNLMSVRVTVIGAIFQLERNFWDLPEDQQRHLVRRIMERHPEWDPASEGVEHLVEKDSDV